MIIQIDTSFPPSRAVRKWVYGFAARNGGLKTGKKFKKGTKEYEEFYGRLVAAGKRARQARGIPEGVITYNSYHKWNLRYFGKAKKCQNLECPGISKRFERALIHGKQHARGIENYLELCHPCHSKYDQKNIAPVLKK